MNKFKIDFPFFEYYPKAIYFDSAATSLKPSIVIDAQSDYQKMVGSNPHSTDYDLAIEANEILDKTRLKTQKFINAASSKEIIFNSGATMGINFLVSALTENLTSNDEVFLTTIEHSSNLLPWIVASQKKGFKIKKIPLDKDFKIDLEALKKLVSSQTKIVSFASISNTVGVYNDSKMINETIKNINKNTLVIVDATQEIGHRVVDVQKSGVDFLVFSAHKMYGPFGLGVIYGKLNLLEQISPVTYGGGNNDAIDWKTFTYTLSPIPQRFESGTPNISAIAGFNKTLDYLSTIGMDNIFQHEIELKEYLIKKFYELNLDKTINSYNLTNLGPIFGFNIVGFNPQDIAAFLANDYQIFTRSGAQCARTTNEELHFKTSVRISFGIYNTFHDIDILLTALSNLDHVYDHILK